MSSTRDWTVRIRHILEAIARIQDYTQGLTVESFAANQMAIDAVVRNFQVIGEAVRHVPNNVQQANTELPWSKMRNMRHVLVHRYEFVDVPTVWITAQDDLPPLVPQLEMLLVEAGGIE